MENNSQWNIKYIPYKEIAKQTALEYYYENKEKIKEKIKISIIYYHQKKKRSVKKIKKNGLINSQKRKQNTA